MTELEIFSYKKGQTSYYKETIEALCTSKYSTPQGLLCPNGEHNE